MSGPNDVITDGGLTPDASWLRNPAHCLSLGFGSGLAPKAPGTFGSFAALPFIGILWWLEAGLFAQIAFAIVPETRPGDRRNMGFFQQAVLQGARVHSGPGDVREGIESAGRLDAGDAGEGV